MLEGVVYHTSIVSSKPNNGLTECGSGSNDNGKVSKLTYPVGKDTSNELSEPSLAGNSNQFGAVAAAEKRFWTEDSFRFGSGYGVAFSFYGCIMAPTVGGFEVENVYG